MDVFEAGAVERSRNPVASGDLQEGAGETPLLIGKEN